MADVVGIILAPRVSIFARGVGFDRDRAFYPTLLAVIASYYVLFAVMAGSMHALFVESAVSGMTPRCPSPKQDRLRCCDHDVAPAGPTVGLPPRVLPAWPEPSSMTLAIDL